MIPLLWNLDKDKSTMTDRSVVAWGEMCWSNCLGRSSCKQQDKQMSQKLWIVGVISIFNADTLEIKIQRITRRFSVVGKSTI